MFEFDYLPPYKKSIRYVFNLKLRDHDRVTYLVPEFLGCSFSKYLNIHILLHFYKIIKIGQPMILMEEFSFIH